MKPPIEIAREFIAIVDWLNSVPGMMTSHHLGHEKVCRALIATDDALATLSRHIKESVDWPGKSLSDVAVFVEVRNQMKAAGLWRVRSG